MKKRILITGASGFLGLACADFLQAQGHELLRPSHQECDISEIQNVYSYIHSVKPDIILHLAGQNSSKTSFLDPRDTFDSNIFGTFSVLEAAKRLKPRVIFMSTGGVYKKSMLPLTEKCALEPRNPYAVSKLAAEHIVHTLCSQYAIPFLIVRGFRMSGAGQRTKAALGEMACQIARCEMSGNPMTIKVENPDSVTDCLDGRDAARAIDALIQHDVTHETYNLCSGIGYSLIDLAERLKKLSTNPSSITFEKSGDSKDMIIGDYAKLKMHTGWQPHYDILTQTLPDLLNYWRSELRLKAKS